MRFIRILTEYMRRVAEFRIRKKRSGRSGSDGISRLNRLLQ